MANNKTFIKITNKDMFKEICQLKEDNERQHTVLMKNQEQLRILLNDHLHEHKIRAQENKKRIVYERWIWGIVISILGISAGLLARFT